MRIQPLCQLTGQVLTPTERRMLNSENDHLQFRFKKWQSEWDSNPRDVSAYTVSNRAPSTTRTSLYVFEFNYGAFCLHLFDEPKTKAKPTPKPPLALQFPASRPQMKTKQSQLAQPLSSAAVQTAKPEDCLGRKPRKLPASSASQP